MHQYAMKSLLGGARAVSKTQFSTLTSLPQQPTLRSLFHLQAYHKSTSSFPTSLSLLSRRGYSNKPLVDKVKEEAEELKEKASEAAEKIKEGGEEVQKKVKNAFKEHWIAPEAYPIFVVIAIALGVCGYHLWKLLRDPNCVYTKSNPEPWLKVQPGTHQKYGYVNQQFERRYSRE